MKKMNKDTQNALKKQAKAMGISMKEAQLKYDSDKGYYLAGWKEHQQKQATKAVDKGIKEGSLAERAHKRKKKIDEKSGF